MTGTNGKLVVISGPSGAGKTSVCRALKQLPEVEFSVSATTRQRRRRERDGVDYHFLDRGDFERRIAAGELLEWADYNGNLYGTLRAPMEAALARGRIYLVEIEVAGTQQLREQRAEGLYLFIEPPSIDELRRRLVARGSNSAAEIGQRVAIAAEEMRLAHEQFLGKPLYDVIVVNDVLEDAIARCKELILA